MSFLFYYCLVTFIAATLTLKYCNIYAAGGIVGFAVGAFFGALGSALGPGRSISYAIRGIFGLALLGAVAGVVAVKFAFIGADLANFIVQQYVEFVTH